MGRRQGPAARQGGRAGGGSGAPASTPRASCRPSCRVAAASRCMFAALFGFGLVASGAGAVGWGCLRCCGAAGRRRN